MPRDPPCAVCTEKSEAAVCRQRHMCTAALEAAKPWIEGKEIERLIMVKEKREPDLVKLVNIVPKEE